ncbi:hypothetical protein BJV85_001511 [Clostridium acetobutylicum]|uniref:Predicted membrane protein n=1 Tax=Clostridium acetobutylicum (strain ATCC 824 / DSM 792 / JCM 1419 / IAM 19013 / LMG 5710 / NBRC 13948 / NRRL B-527 / VKM B-1787 / 2291 / W) TaxID=272562 RepID=Q97GJ3_CLOAB|nr:MULTISPECIES: hypothetical protein [Clostridium]AAK80329.1 Predicted membrane protein [Clostridium acetobutylicum ATCC 824]ADZ21425.1 membrane protein [Clostridium acetobutylicum EA 2018]AEI32308.1 hypothetical protein SMB_G2408 [Clostridium acetobutylicum DSM 1731]AWV79249.1 hypothetical protein DK921_03865 [Clostridium acetobutylicum]KHD38505.1 membrane protein [Clostridium acetobutylicum]
MRGVKDHSEFKDENVQIGFKDKLAFIIAAFEAFLPIFLLVIGGTFLVILLLLKLWF